jgi:uncharacterized protein
MKLGRSLDPPGYTRQTIGANIVISTSTPTIDASRHEIEDSIGAACSRIAPVWPLESFVAVNPYLGLIDRPFDDAARLLAVTAGAHSTMPVDYYLDAIATGRITERDLDAASTDLRGSLVAAGKTARTDAPSVLDGPFVPVSTVGDVATALDGNDWGRFSLDRVSAWAAAYFDHGQAMWRSADEQLSLFEAWKYDASVDRTPEIMGLKGFRSVVRSLPDDPAAAARRALAELDVPIAALDLYLHAVLMRANGWASHAARLDWEARLLGHEGDALRQFLTILLGWELALYRRHPSAEMAAAWRQASGTLAETADAHQLRSSRTEVLGLHEAFERAHERELVGQLSGHPAADEANGRPEVQAVFCIDVRSEVIRRHLEAVGPDINTFGFAGFFGVPIEFVPLAHDRGEPQCPVLLRPGHTVLEVLHGDDATSHAIEGRRLGHHVRRAWKSFKMGAISCFSFVGPVGLIYLPKLMTDMVGWTRPVPRPGEEGLSADQVNDRRPSIEPTTSDGIIAGITGPERLRLAESALRGMSLTDGFARVVMITGHGATTVNNPYATGLDCGACGGHTGEANARVAAAILNDPRVREGLADRGIHIPGDTWFVPALHDTTTDVITLFDTGSAPGSHRGLLDTLARRLDQAAHLARAERAVRLGIEDPASVDDAVIRRSTDWAQVRPEWGLAGCRAFVAAPRSRTRGLDLGGRAFLHSYDWRRDDGFGVLESIMTAPMVVASWINLQYYASTVDNHLFGSGNKTLHNVIGKLGVLEGNGGDLRTGLPWQSVSDGQGLQHEPVRLKVVIEAPLEAINRVLAAHPDVRDLCDNGWVQLLAMDDFGAVANRYSGDLRWEAITS